MSKAPKGGGDHSADKQAKNGRPKGFPAQRKQKGDRACEHNKEFGHVDCADGLAWPCAVDDQIGRDNRPPSAAASGIEKPACKPERAHHPGISVRAVPHAFAEQQLDAENGKIDLAEQLCRFDRKAC